MAAETDTVTIAPRFCGPPNGGNGGYTCGLVAAPLGPDAVEVTLFLPPPLEVELDREVDEGRTGPVVRLLDGDELVAEGCPRPLDLAVPPLPSAEQAAEAEGRFPWWDTHPFPSCFVCGTARTPGDGLCIHPGPVAGGEAERRGVFATLWTPDAGLADGDGRVRSEFVWSALDCPSGIPILTRADVTPGVLGRLVAEQLAPVDAGRPYIVAGWGISSEGRKHRGGAVVADAETGAVVGRSQGTWIELR